MDSILRSLETQKGQNAPWLIQYPHQKLCGYWFYIFGITHVGSYEPGPRLPMRFQIIDIISPSQNFPLPQDNVSSPNVKDLVVTGTKLGRMKAGLYQLQNVGNDLLPDLNNYRFCRLGVFGL